MPELNDTQTIVDTAQEAVDPFLVDRGIYLARDSAGSTQVVDVRRQLDEDAESPARKKGAFTVSDVDSFVGYVAKHGLDETELWANIDHASIRAVINAHHGAGALAGWADHTATLQLPAHRRLARVDRAGREAAAPSTRRNGSSPARRRSRTGRTPRPRPARRVRWPSRTRSSWRSSPSRAATATWWAPGSGTGSTGRTCTSATGSPDPVTSSATHSAPSSPRSRPIPRGRSGRPPDHLGRAGVTRPARPQPGTPRKEIPRPMRAYGSCATSTGTTTSHVPIPTSPVRYAVGDILDQVERAHSRVSPIVLRDGPDPRAVARLARVEKPRSQRAAPTPRQAREPRPQRERKAQQHRPAREPVRRGPQVNEQRILELYAAGQTIPAIRESTGHAKGTIRTTLLRNGVTLRDDRTTHSGGKSAITSADRQRVVALYLSGMHAGQVAREVGYGETTIGRILHAAGVDIRSSGDAQRGRPGVDGAAALRELMAACGVTPADVRAWAASVGRSCPVNGFPPRSLVDAYMSTLTGESAA